MQSRIEDSGEFETAIRDDPFALLNTIKPRMCRQVQAKCVFAQPTETSIQFLTLKQDHGESLSEHDKRFKQSLDDCKAIFGENAPHEHVTKTENHENTKQNQTTRK